MLALMMEMSAGIKMLDIRIEKETYGLILITSNVCDYLIEEDDTTKKKIIDELKDIFDTEYKYKKNIEYVNSWALLGIHDLAILVKSKSKLYDAITDIGKLLNKRS